MRTHTTAAFLVALVGVSQLAYADDAPTPRAKVAPWVLVGVGAPATVVGTAFEMFALATERPGHMTCGADCAFARRDAGNDTSAVQAAAIVTMSMGLGAVLAGLIWHLSERTSRVVVSPTLGGVAFHATF